VGHGLQAGIAQGPLINQAGKSKVTRHILDATEKGAKIAFGDHCNTNLKDNTGNFVSPMVLVGCQENMSCFQEETFGPLVSIAKFSNEEEMIKVANNTNVGLAGYFCSQDLK
jgi:succinate-semialdehyde dehydrogenase / glutarate-semialdehyde dehydrogenase